MVLGLVGGIARSPCVGRSKQVKQVFIRFFAQASRPNYHHIGSEMTLDNVPLTALGASEQQASLAALPEDLWRKIPGAVTVDRG